jgi:GDPmannose 4,6-dehydratase
MPSALITGITGQDGSYLSEFLLEKGYEVHGLVRRSSIPNLSRIEHIRDRITLHYGDLSDSSSLISVIGKSYPSEVYNLAAMSDVGISYVIPEYSADVTGTGTIRLLETLHTVGCPARFYQASSSEMFGKSPPPQNEDTPFRPGAHTAAQKRSRITQR